MPGASRRKAVGYRVDSGLDALRVVDGLYRCALEGGAWEECAREVRDFLRCTCVCIAWRGEPDGQVRHFSSRRAGDRDRDGVPLRCGVVAARMFDDRLTRQSVPLEASDRSSSETGTGRLRLYAWHREIGRCPYCVGAKVEVDEQTSAFLGAHWRRVEDLVGTDAEQRLQGLLAPFVRALRLRARLGRLVGQLAASDGALDHLPLGVLFLAAEGRLVHANASARRLLEAGDGLRVEDGHLRARSPAAQARLEVALARVTSGSGPEECVPIPRASGARDLELMLMRQERADGAAAVIAYLGDPERPAEVDAGALERFFGLTPAEARVAAALASGASVSEVARRLEVAVSTVREHLGHVFAKTGVHRQGELLRLVLESPALIEGGPDR